MTLRIENAATGHALSWVYLALAVLFIMLQALLAPTAAAQALEPGILIMSNKRAGKKKNATHVSACSIPDSPPAWPHGSRGSGMRHRPLQTGSEPVPAAENVAAVALEGS